MMEVTKAVSHGVAKSGNGRERRGVVRWVTILMSVVGLAIGVLAVSMAREKPVELPLARAPSINPYGRGVAALGTIEPSGRDVAIVAPEAALVTEVHVDVGAQVASGAALFQLDPRPVQADLVRAEAAVRVGEAEVARWRALPRAEDLPPLLAEVARTEALMNDAAERFRLTEEAVRRGAANERDISRDRFALDAARAAVAGATAGLDRARAGGWIGDLAVLEADLAGNRAEVEAQRLLMERLTVRAPRDGTVLRRDIEAGEYATTNPDRPALIVGDLTRLNVRAQVDEEDIALVGASPEALARTRGSVVREMRLRLLRIEPYARPKMDITGANTERVDTRVVDVVFEVVGEAGAVYPGQAVDVFIDAGATGPTQPPP